MNPTEDSCLYANVKITIKAAQKPAETLYVEPTRAASVDPMIMSCRPMDSPTFLHGRPTSLTFDVLFNTRPYAKDRDVETQQLADLKDSFKLKAATVSLPGGVGTELQLPPVQVTSTTKEYRQDEHHVRVEFDISEFENAATEKLLWAQLVVLETLVDKDGTTFAVASRLEARGMPIFVFEQADMEQLIKEETPQVQEAIAGTAIAAEGQQEVSADVMTAKSDLEAKVEEQKHEEAEKHEDKQVKCLCVHGTCNDGEAECSRCEGGWTGTYCDTPVRGGQLENVNKNQEKDFTKDGLYRPQSIGD